MKYKNRNWFIRLLFTCLILVVLLFPLAGIVLATPPGASVSAQAASPPTFDLTSDLLALIAGAVLSLGFSYIPGLRTRYAKLDDTTKRGYMAILLLIVAAGLFGLQCTNILFIGIACTHAGAQSIVWIFILALVGNQSAFSISPRTADVQKAKALRDATATTTNG